MMYLTFWSSIILYKYCFIKHKIYDYFILLEISKIAYYTTQ